MKIFGIQFGKSPPEPPLPLRSIRESEEQDCIFLEWSERIGLDSGAVRARALRRVLHEEKIPTFENHEVWDYLEFFETRRDRVVCRPLRRCDAQVRIQICGGTHRGLAYSSIESHKFPRWNDDVPLEALRIVNTLEDKLARPDDVTDDELLRVYDKRYKEACEEAQSGKSPVVPLDEARRALFELGHEWKRKDHEAGWGFFVTVSRAPAQAFLTIATAGTSLTFLTSWLPKDYE